MASKRLSLNAWPGPVVLLYLGKGKPEQVLAAATDADPAKERDQHCKAYFYLAEHALLRGQRAEALDLFREAIATCQTTYYYEYAAAAQAELGRLSNSTAIQPPRP